MFTLLRGNWSQMVAIDQRSTWTDAEKTAYQVLDTSHDMHQWHTLNDWLIDYLLFYVSLKNFSLIWRRHRAAKFRPMVGAQGLWAGRDLCRATPTVTRNLGFSGLIRRTAPINHLLRHAWGCGGPILTRILTGAHAEWTMKQKVSVING
jgi:hypothetical protein